MIRLCGRLQPSVRMAVIYDNKVLLHTFTWCICIYQPTLRRPLNFVSQYLQRYTGFSASVSVKIWSSPCSTEVMHRGFLQRITFRISFGRERGLFSTIFSFLIITPNHKPILKLPRDIKSYFYISSYPNMSTYIKSNKNG